MKSSRSTQCFLVYIWRYINRKTDRDAISNAAQSWQWALIIIQHTAYQYFSTIESVRKNGEAEERLSYRIYMHLGLAHMNCTAYQANRIVILNAWPINSIEERIKMIDWSIFPIDINHRYVQFKKWYISNCKGFLAVMKRHVMEFFWMNATNYKNSFVSWRKRARKL